MATQAEEGPQSFGAHEAGPRADNGHRLHDVASNDVASSFDDDVGDKAQVGRLSKWQKIKQHFQRRWWIYLIAVIIFLAIFLPILFEVIIPVIIRAIVDDQEMPVNRGVLNFTAPTSLHITLDTSLDTPLPVKIDRLPLSLIQPSADGDHGSGTPFLTLQMPEQHIHHETEVIIPDQIVDILDHTQLVAWFNEFFDKEEAELRLKADDLSAHLGALDYQVNLDKTIKVPGLNYLKGFGVRNMQFNISPGPSGHNMHGHLNIPNAGVLTLGLGNVTFDVMAGDIKLGLVYIYNLDLKPGNNTPPFEGDFYFDRLVPNLAAFIDTQHDALTNGMVEFNATGNSAFHNGERIAYVEGVLNQKSIPFRIPVTTLLLDVVSGLLAGGTNGSEVPLLDTLGDVLGNKTLFENMLAHFETGDTGSGAHSTMKNTKVKRTVAHTLGRSMQMNLFRLGLRTLLSEY